MQYFYVSRNKRRGLADKTNVGNQMEPNWTKIYIFFLYFIATVAVHNFVL